MLKKQILHWSAYMLQGEPLPNIFPIKYKGNLIIGIYYTRE